MVSSLHLLPLPGRCADLHPGQIYATGTPLLIPVGAGLVTGIRERLSGGTQRLLTTDDLISRDSTVDALWSDAAWQMLSTLSHLTGIHGTALRHRRLTGGVREIGVLDNAFPAAGLLAHPLLIRPVRRLLGATPQVSVTASGRLLILGGNPAPPQPDQLSTLINGESCSPVLHLGDSSSPGLLQKEMVGALQ